MPNVSIIIPSYNHIEFLQKRFDSILTQSYKDWEAIIIDDKSTDRSVNFIENYIESNPEFIIKHFIVNETNSGSGYFSWQKGLELAQSKYIWIAETDDYSEPNFLFEMVSILDQNESSSLIFCGSNYVESNKIIYDTTNRTSDLGVDSGGFKVFKSETFLRRMPFDTYITNGSSVVFRKPKEKINPEIFNNRQCSDLFLWTFLVKNSEFIFLNKTLNFFRRHENSTTTKISCLSRKIIYVEKLKYLDFFEQNYKFQTLVDHYVKDYICSNKKEVFNYKFLKQIKGIKRIEIKYFKTVIKFILIKIKLRWK